LNGPLSNLRVLDLTHARAGPVAVRLLADWGADVIKVEPPQGDETREWGPPFAHGLSAYYASLNRNKRSIALDLSHVEGRAVVLRRLENADVLIENFKVGTLAKYRLGYASLKRVNPRLIYCSISAYGQDGPAAAEPGYDAMIQAVSGLMSITGVPDGEPGAGPVKVGAAFDEPNRDLVDSLLGEAPETASPFMEEAPLDTEHAPAPLGPAGDVLESTYATSTPRAEVVEVLPPTASAGQ